MGFGGILVIFRFRGYFGHFLGFEGILVIFRFWGYFGHFLGFGGVGPEGLQSGPNSVWAQGPCRGCLVPRTKGRWPGCQGERLRITLSSAPRGFNEKTIVLVKAIPKQPFEGDVNGIKPTWKYGAWQAQGRYVPSVLNALANDQIRLMRKDVWTV